jgi:hypothetical protein
MPRSNPPEPQLARLDDGSRLELPHEQDSGHLPGGGTGAANREFARKSAVLL